MRRRTYIPRMGPKKTVQRPVNYVKKQPGMTRMLKEWYVRHKGYYADFKKRIETGLMNNDPKVLDEFKQMLSLFPELQSKNPDEFAKDMISQAPKRFEDYTWDKKNVRLIGASINRTFYFWGIFIEYLISQMTRDSGRIECH